MESTMAYSFEYRRRSWPPTQTALSKSQRPTSAPKDAPKQKSRPPQPRPDDWIDPKALVMQNIPFHVKKEAIQRLMKCQKLPMPHTITYFLERSFFKGTAFLNFSSRDEARTVKMALDGLTIADRTLYVMYKIDPHKAGDKKCRCDSILASECGPDPVRSNNVSTSAKSCLHTISHWHIYRGRAPPVHIEIKSQRLRGFYTQTKQYHGVVTDGEHVRFLETESTTYQHWWFTEELEHQIPFQSCRPASPLDEVVLPVFGKVASGKALILALREDDDVEASLLLREIYEEVILGVTSKGLQYPLDD